ncbi:MAG: hypothetical protein IJ764_03730 [Bacteroidales bacterium]|nr:hypothetical protein [Bacteroidales bacterium]
MKRIIAFLGFVVAVGSLWAQDTLAPLQEPVMVNVEDSADRPDLGFRIQQLRDSLHTLQQAAVQDSASLSMSALRIRTLQNQLDGLSRQRDSLEASNARYQDELKEKNSLMQKQLAAMQEKEQLLAEKEQLYREAMTNSTIDRVKLQAEIDTRTARIEAKSREVEFLQQDIEAKNARLEEQKASYEQLAQQSAGYRRHIDSLQAIVTAHEKEIIRKEEQAKYMEERAKAAEAKISEATNRKKKVRPIQGVAMRFFRTPQWEILLTPENDGSYGKVVRNRNAGNVEFDFLTGASVMLWDMTKYFNRSHSIELKKGDTVRSVQTMKQFDQSFAYDLGVYVGFGGSNLFKNFYLGASFRFLDFFYLISGVNIAEYELLDSSHSEGGRVDTNHTLDNITVKSWKVKPFVALSIDLEFLSYIKK